MQKGNSKQIRTAVDEHFLETYRKRGLSHASLQGQSIAQNMHCRLAEDQALERRGTEQITLAHVPATDCPDCLASLHCWGRMRVLELLAHKKRCRGVIRQRLRRHSRSALALVPAAGIRPRYSHAGGWQSRVPSGSGSACADRPCSLLPRLRGARTAHCAFCRFYLEQAPGRRHSVLSHAPLQASTPPPQFQVRLRVTPAIT